MSKIQLQTSDNQIFEVELKTVKCFGIRKALFEHCDADDENAVIPLAKVNAATLRKVLEWAEHYKNEANLIKEEELCVEQVNIIPAWDVEFLKVDLETLRDLIMAANYLDIRSLLLSGCKTVAQMIRGKTPEQIRQIFQIEDKPSADDYCE